jgi:hypothetical protein
LLARFDQNGHGIKCRVTFARPEQPPRARVAFRGARSRRVALIGRWRPSAKEAVALPFGLTRLLRVGLLPRQAILRLVPAIRAPHNAASKRFRVSSGLNRSSLLSMGTPDSMKKRKRLTSWFRQHLPHLSRHQFTEGHYQPHARSIGRLLLAWNDLHERLSTLFVMAMGLRQFIRSFAVWHETRSDLNKRRLLRAAMKNLRRISG